MIAYLSERLVMYEDTPTPCLENSPQKFEKEYKSVHDYDHAPHATGSNFSSSNGLTDHVVLLPRTQVNKHNTYTYTHTLGRTHRTNTNWQIIMTFWKCYTPDMRFYPPPPTHTHTTHKQINTQPTNHTRKHTCIHKSIANRHNVCYRSFHDSAPSNARAHACAHAHAHTHAHTHARTHAHTHTHTHAHVLCVCVWICTLCLSAAV